MLDDMKSVETRTGRSYMFRAARGPARNLVWVDREERELPRSRELIAKPYAEDKATEELTS